MERAQRFKQMGNESFSDGKYDESILYYTKAIDTCLKDNSSELSIYHQNRAAAYEKLVISIFRLLVRPLFSILPLFSPIPKNSPKFIYFLLFLFFNF